MNASALAQKIRLGLVALLCLLVLGAEFAEYEFFAELKAETKQFTFNELASIGQLKAGQLTAFLKERRGDSLVITDLLPLGLTQHWWDNTNRNLPASLQQPLKSAVAYYDYAGAMILDAKGNIRFRIGYSMDLSETTKSFVQTVLQTSPPPFSEIYAADQAAPEQLTLDTFAPIKNANKTKTLGVLVLRGNWPGLFEMIQSWPTESRTAETLLVKHDSSQVILLNEPRHKTQTALKPHVPMMIGADAPPWPTIKAAQGHIGQLESFDYRGQAVLAHILPVQGTPWNMVIKVDTEEVLEQLRFLQLIMATGTLLAAVGAGLWGYRWQRKREQARALREAQQIEHRLAAIIDSATDAIISVDEDQRILLFNPTAEQLFKCAAQDALGQPIDRFIPHRFRDTHHAQVQAFRTAGQTTRKMGILGAISGLRTDGQEFPIEASISQTQTDGHTLYTVILRDISQRIRTETALTQSEERLRLALSAANEGLYDLNVQTGACTVSPEYAFMLGYDPAEFRETNEAWRERLHPDDRAEVYRVYEDYVAGRRNDYRVEFRQRTKTGGWKWISSVGRMVQHSADGRPLRMTGIHADITERKQAEERLAEAHAMLNLILNNIPLCVFWKDRTSTYLGSNTLFAQAAGVGSPQDLIGKTDHELAWKDTAERYRTDDRLVMETKTPKLNFEEPQTRPDGSVLWLSTSKVPLLSRTGEVFGILGIYEDITERKKASEREVARARTLQKLSELGLQLTGTSDEIFRHLVRVISELFAVRVVCLSEILGAHLSFRAVYVDGEVFVNAGGCPIDVTPCATVETTKDIRLYDRVAERFPQAAFLRDHQASAYCGFPSLDSAGRVVAVTCLLDDKPREFSEEDQGILRIIGQRVATELDRTRAEQALQANEARLMEAQHLAQIGNWELNLATSALTWSDEIFRIFEIDPTKFNASYDTFLSLIHPEDRDLVNKAYRTSVETRAPYEIVHRLLMTDGRVKHVQEHGETFYDEATGQPLRSTGTVQDITVLKQAELALTQSESLFRTLATVAPVGIFRTDATGNCLYVNERWCAITGLSADSAAGDGWTAALHQDDRARVAEEWAQTLRDHRPFRSEYRFRATDRMETWVVGQAQAELDRDGRTLGYVGTITDISERKHIELRIEASLREKETLLREVHHRVKNNLQIISSLLHFQAKKAQHEIELTALREGQDRLRAMILVHELLYRSTDLHRISLGEYLTALTDQLQRSFREAAAHVRLRIEADNLSVPATIALPCGMIVTELVTNAFKYAYPSGAEGPLVIRIASGEGSFLLSVSDEGVGLPAEFDLRQSSSFGLHLVANLADQLGARLTRPPGIGTEIVLEVPLPSSAAEPERPRGSAAQPLHQSESIL
jgi:PAS domain S-box-containing protein